MGCLSSKPKDWATKKGTDRALSFSSLTACKKGLTKTEIQMRIVAPLSCRTFVHDGISIKYAWVSQRGYYPDAPDKDNQDSCCVIPNMFENDEEMPKVALFGVFDGHGSEGHLCSRFVSDQLTKNLTEKLRESQAEGMKGTEKAVLKAHKLTNDALHADKTIDSSFSGTTSISVLLREQTMYVSNVGDSRAIVLSRKGLGMQASAMSSDHTPYRKDERFRVMKYGARILSVDQVLQNDVQINDNWGDITLGDDLDEAGDPPRVWALDGAYPGTAFTRSLGDKVAEGLGVTAEPEILIRQILTNDKYVVIASDGVFEFLNNQMVADIVAEKEDPLDACHAVVAAAYDLWLRYDVRTDDITIVILQIVDVEPGLLAPQETSTRNILQSQFFSNAQIFDSAQPVNPSARVLNDTRPVRRVISREKRKRIIFTPVYEKEGDTGLKKEDCVLLPIPKNDKDALAIGGAIKVNFLFQHLSEEQRNDVVSYMQPLQVKAGEWVIKQGDEGDKFYVIGEGRFEVRIKAIDDDEENGGNVVHVYEASHDNHPGFGELSLLYGRPRAASVIALKDSTLWYLNKQIFNSVVVRSIDSHKNTKQILRKVQLFSCLSIEHIRKIVGVLRVVKFVAGDSIAREGVSDDKFYVILSGECESKSQGNGGRNATLKGNDYFNENSLLGIYETALSTVVAITDVKLLYVTRKDFESEVGFLAPKVESHKMIRLATLNRDDAPKAFSDISIKGLVSSDAMGLILLGHFGELPDSPRVTVRTYLLKDVEKHEDINAVLNAAEAFRVITSCTQKNCFVYRLLGVFHDVNALHLVLNIPVVADLDSLLRARSEDNSVRTSKDVFIYVAICVFSALDFLHSLGIIYRSVQPESIYVDMHGRLVLGGYRVSKVGKVGGKTYTITGAAEYFAPEQVSRQGHSAPVDFWSLGCVLYELATGVHPFAADSEVAIYQKISSFGTRAFPKLFYPEGTAPEIVYIIDKLLVPVPELRLGAGPNGFLAVRKTFEGIDWSKFHITPPASPLAASAAVAYEDMVQLGVDSHLQDKFSEPYKTENWSRSVEM